MPLLLLAAAAAPPSPDVRSAAEPEEVLVIGERMRKFRFKVARSGKSGALTCRIKRTSGDPKLDAALCAEARTCVLQNDQAKPDLPVFQTCLEQRFEQVRLARLAAFKAGEKP